jgi:hypothetical protein
MEQQLADDLAADLRTAEAGAAWVRRAEAAVRLGISERTLDNRIRAGKLQKRWAGDHVEILVPQATADDRTEKALVLLDHYHRDLAQQMQPLLDKVETLARENGELRERLRQTEQKLADVSAAPVLPTENVPQVPWWARWRWWWRLRDV